MSDRTCVVCSVPLTGRRPDTKYCSTSCTQKAWRSRTASDRSASPECEGCGGAIVGKRWQARYCSKNCASLHGYYRNKLGTVRDDRACPACLSLIPGNAHGNRVYCSHQCSGVAARVNAYGLTFDEYRKLLDHQQHRCAICGTTGDGMWLRRETRRDGWHIDHDHETGRFRGILCPPCNLILGYAKDNPDILWKAIEYLAVHGVREQTPTH